MGTEELFVSHDSYQILKFHGSYMQDDRSKRKKGQDKVSEGKSARGRFSSAYGVYNYRETWGKICFFVCGPYQEGGNARIGFTFF